MGKRSNKKSTSDDKKICPIYDKCNLRLHPFSATDVPNRVAQPIIRVAYTIIAWCFLGYGINEGFFVSAFLFILPILMDCCRFTPITDVRKKIWRGELTVLVIWCMLALLGIIKVFVLQEADNTWGVVTSEGFIGFQLPFIPLSYVWWALSTVVFAASIDLFFNESRLVEALSNNEKVKGGCQNE